MNDIMGKYKINHFRALQGLNKSQAALEHGET